MPSPGILGFFYSQLFIAPPIPAADLSGQTLIITGSNVGLGFAAAQHVASLKPHRLILAVRTPSKGEKARSDIIASTAGYDDNKTAIDVWELDMSKFASVLAFADRCDRELDRLDGVSLNAGIQTSTYEAMEGYESTILVNVISTYLLAVAMQPTLRKSASRHNIIPRISIVSSETHAWASFPEKSTPAGSSIFEVMSDESKGAGQGRYMDSKLMEILIFRRVLRLLTSGIRQDNNKCKVIWNILNPGFCYSTLSRDGNKVQVVMHFFLARSQEMGGRPIAAGLVAGAESDGKYMHDGVVDEGALSAYVKSQEGEKMGERLWQELKNIFEKVKPGMTEGL